MPGGTMRRFVNFTCCLTFLTLLTSCGLFSRTGHYNVRVVVETDKGSFSAVWRVTASQTGFRIGSENLAGGAGLLGDAVVIETAEGPVFALMRERPQGELLAVSITRALDPDLTSADAGPLLSAVKKLGRRSGQDRKELPEPDWPLMIRFGDITDPGSVALVQPAQIGVRRIDLQTTSEPESRGIEELLPWVPTPQPGSLQRVDRELVALDPFRALTRHVD